MPHLPVEVNPNGAIMCHNTVKLPAFHAAPMPFKRRSRTPLNEFLKQPPTPWEIITVVYRQRDLLEQNYFQKFYCDFVIIIRVYVDLCP